MTSTKEKLSSRLDCALRDLYHNATPNHPSVPDALCDSYSSAFNAWAECEIEYIQDWLGRTPSEYKKEARKGWPNKGEREAWLIASFIEDNGGKLYTWGRGGRTLAPPGLINQRGGRSFSIKSADSFSDYSNEALTLLIQQIEAFNSYVEVWNSRKNLAYMWRDWCETELHELSSSAKHTRKELKRLAREALALAGIAGESACSALKREINSQKLHHKNLVIEIRKFNEALSY